MRDGVPVFHHPSADDFPQAGHRLLRNLAPLGEINLVLGCRPGRSRSAGRFGRLGRANQSLDMRANILQNDTSTWSAAAHFGQINTQIVGHFPNGRRGGNFAVGTHRRCFRFFGGIFVGCFLRRRCRAWCRCGAVLCRRSSGFWRGGRRLAIAFGQRNNFLADAYFIAVLDVDFGDHARRGGWNRRDRLFVFQFQQRLVTSRPCRLPSRKG